MKTALICGVSGQDGSYLAQFLLEKGYRVVGTSRDAQVSTFENLKRLNIFERVEVDSMVLTDFRSTLQVLAKYQPDEVYNLAGQSSVGLSFHQPVETLESISLGTLHLLEVTRFLNKPIRLYNASSSECYGDTGGVAADEETPFRPRSPYAVAKSAAHWEVVNYREAYGLFACNGILFNHESPLRPVRFVTRKIVSAACRIASGSTERLLLGDLNVTRDWGWSPEYVRAMWKMLQQDSADDFVIATGTSASLEEFTTSVFEQLNLDWNDHVDIDKSLFRPSEIREGRGNPEKANKQLSWVAEKKMQNVVCEMVKAELNLSEIES